MVVNKISKGVVMAAGDLRLEALRTDLSCPVSLELLYHAVSLVPCAHKVNEEIARRLFHPEGRAGAFRSAPCPQCRIGVTSYAPDPTIRNIVRTIFGEIEQPEELRLPEASVRVEEVPREELPFPGIKARFVHTGGDWEMFNSGGPLCRSLEFKSITQDSYFQTFGLYGYTDHSLFLRIIPKGRLCLSRADSVPEDLTRYMLHNGFPEDLPAAYIARDADQLRRLFKILAENNEIPEPYYTQMREIIEAGHW